MSAPVSSPSPPIATPCINVCRLDERGYCIGCYRSGEEIGRWRAMSQDERLRLMRDVLPQRAAP